MDSPSEFPDRNIPMVCRNCKNCHRYLPISDWMPSWLSWEYECYSKDRRRYVNGVETCINKEVE